MGGSNTETGQLIQLTYSTKVNHATRLTTMPLCRYNNSQSAAESVKIYMAGCFPSMTSCSMFREARLIFGGGANYNEMHVYLLAYCTAA